MITARQLFETGYDLIWIAWGEQAIREALASIRLAMAAHDHMRNIGYKLVTYGDVDNKIKRLLRLATERGVDHQVCVADRPLDGQYIDLWRMRALSMVQRPTFYCDSDLVFFDDLLRTAPLDSFDCMAYTHFNCGDDMAKIVESVVGRPYLHKSEVSGHRYWEPKLRMCTGMLFAEYGGAVKSWLGKYEQYCDKLASMCDFYFPEPLITAMRIKGEIKCQLHHREGIEVALNDTSDFHDKVLLETNGVSIIRARHIHGHGVGHAWHCPGMQLKRLEFIMDDEGNVVSPRCSLKTLAGLPITGSIML